jgi:hypothetical protein
LERVGLERLSPELRDFWPHRGPQWDALAEFGNEGVMLVEAKAHVGELCSSSCEAKSPSLEMIEEALNEAAEYICARPRATWTECFYQLGESDRPSLLGLPKRHKHSNDIIEIFPDVGAWRSQ